MGLQITAQPASEPVTLADAKLWCRIDHAVEDSVVTSLISTARRLCETFLRRPLINTSYLWTFDGFPGYILPTLRDPTFFNVVRESQDLIMRFPIGGVTSIGISGSPPTPAIQYVDQDTQLWVTLDPSMYVADFTEQPARLAPAFQQQWPTALSQIGSVRIAFTAGYGSLATSVPAEILSAVKLILCDIWNNKGDSNLQFNSYTVPHSAEMLMFDERVWPIRKG